MVVRQSLSYISQLCVLEKSPSGGALTQCSALVTNLLAGQVAPLAFFHMLPWNALFLSLCLESDGKIFWEDKQPLWTAPETGS